MIEAEMTEIVPAVVDAINKMRGILSVTTTENKLAIYCSENLKSQIEEAIIDNKGFLVGMKIQSYVSLVKVDVDGGDILLKSEAEIGVHPAPVEAISGGEFKQLAGDG